jgi:hypothetical protein
MKKSNTIAVTGVWFLTKLISRLVRDQAFKALYIFVKKIEEHAAQMVRALLGYGIVFS